MYKVYIYILFEFLLFVDYRVADVRYMFSESRQSSGIM